MSTIGYIGLGIMGAAMARNLMRAGHALVVHNRSRAIVDALVSEGATAANSPAEVASAHHIPVSEFLRKDAPWLDDVPTSRHPMLRMPVGDDYIAAPTAALIYQFREVCLLGRHTRVAHYEQPAFAWR